MLSKPQWLILLVPALIYLWRVRMPSRLLQVLRTIIVIAAVICLCSPKFKLPGKDGMLIVVADRSLSMPNNIDSRISETMELLGDSRPTHGKVGLITYGANVAVEMQPDKAGFSGLTSDNDPGGSNLGEAISRASSLIPTDSSGRILVLSDGNWTGKNPLKSAHEASKRAIPIDYRLLNRNNLDDLAILNFEVPGLVNPGEAFLISAVVHSSRSQNAKLTLKADGKIISRVDSQFVKGKNPIVFRHRTGSDKVIEYELNVTGEGIDKVPENNTALGITEVFGKKPTLMLTENSATRFPNLLNQAGIKTLVKSPKEMRWNIESLSGYSTIIIDDISANAISSHGMRVLEAWVKHLGGGLLMLGGKNSYGPGGYYQSPLEAALPVSLELRNEHRKLALALVIVLDRSGSMAAPAGGDRTKMDLANIAAAGTLDMLSPLDEFGVLAVDTKAHTVVRLDNHKDKESVRDKILRIESTGGGIYVSEGLTTAAKMLTEAKAKTRHIILFADAADAEQPGRYWELLDKCKKAGITCSVIGLGRPTDSDANLLRKIAKEGDGRIFFTRDPAELPRLFSQDTFVAAKSSFIEELTSVSSANSVSLLFDKPISFSSSVKGYNLCYRRPKAHLAAITNDDNKAPLLAFWNYGLGRTACYMGEVEGKFSGNLTSTEAAADLFTAVVKWISPDNRQSVENMVVTQKIQNGKWLATLHLDPDREKETFSEVPNIVVMQSIQGKTPVEHLIKMKWDTADSLIAELPLSGNETIVSAIRISKNKLLKLFPIRLPYSQEYSLTKAGAGSERLNEISIITGGKERLNLGNIWEDLPEIIQFKDISAPIIYFIVFLFFIEILERRTGIISSLLFRKRRVPASSASYEELVFKPSEVSRSGKTLSSLTASEKEVEKEEKDKPAFIGALKRAKKKAGKITKKKD
jgi:uncharacterized membrane protein/Mg-chelatase subunit ChlD